MVTFGRGKDGNGWERIGSDRRGSDGEQAQDTHPRREMRKSVSGWRLCVGGWVDVDVRMGLFKRYICWIGEDWEGEEGRGRIVVEWKGRVVDW